MVNFMLCMFYQYGSGCQLDHGVELDSHQGEEQVPPVSCERRHRGHVITPMPEKGFLFPAA